MSNLPPVKIPRVAGPRKRIKIAPVAAGLGLIGTMVFAGLAGNRAARVEEASALPPLRATTTTAPAPAPPAIAAVVQPPPAITIPMTSTPQPTVPVVVQSRPLPTYAPMPVTPAPATTENSNASRERARTSSPTLVIDIPPAKTGELQPGSGTGGPFLPVDLLFRSASFQPVPAGIDPAAVAPAADAAPVVAPPVASSAAPVFAPSVERSDNDNLRDLNSNERFSARASGRETEVVRARRLPDQHALVTEGTIIGAVMETALNSDVPGFARAIVTRDVLSFDGSHVLIPAGSRVIGEYNSGVAQGASRIFIVWNRLIRPDGVSVGLASPAVDDLGRGGLAGKVNRHFFQRFGGAILTTVLGGAINAFAQSRSNGSTVIVSSTNQASSLAEQATRGADIPPTITTPQGALVRIFVARDLDFSDVGPAE